MSASDTPEQAVGEPLGEAVKVEAEQFGACFATDDCRTGVQSFMENGPGKATFSGR